MSKGWAEIWWVAILKTVFLALCRACFLLAQGIWWRLRGTQKLLEHSKEEGNYSRSAHVQDVVFRFALSDIGPHAAFNFITTHNQLTHPDYVLADHVSLYDITKTEAVFVEVDPSIDVYTPNTAPFTRQNQYTYAKRLITMPIASFHQLAESLGDPKGNIIILSSTGRCGSTLLSQVFEAAGNCLNLCETQAFMSAMTLRNDMDDKSDDAYFHLVRNIIRVQCKPLGEKTSAYFIKTMSMNMDIVPLLCERMPAVTHLFMYRDSWETIKSMQRAFCKHPFFHFFTRFGQYFPSMSGSFKGMSDYLITEETWEQIRPKLFSEASIFAYIHAVSVAAYLKYQKAGLPIKAIRYEDVVENPRKATQVLFQYCNMPAKLVSKAAEAFSIDSQRGSSLAKRKTRENDLLFDYKGQTKNEIDSMCCLFGIPVPADRARFPGTLDI